MSRTIRRKNVWNTGTYYGDERGYTHEDDTEHAKLHGGWKTYTYTDWTTKEKISKTYYSDVAWGGRKSVPKKGREFKKGWWKYHGDSMRFWSGNKGPGWWVTEFVQRPYRRDAKHQLYLAMKDDDYEVVIQSKPKRGWWD